MTVSKQAIRQARELLRACQTDGLMDEGRVRAAVRRVLAARPRGWVAMLEHFQRLVRLEVERRTAHIESPAGLPADLQAALEARLARAYGPGLRLRYGQEPALIGGLRIRVGSDVYDGSIKARLAAVQAALEGEGP